MAEFSDYGNKYKTISMERDDGILLMTFHTGDGPLRWSLSAHDEFGRVFQDVANDRDNRVVIMTGRGDEFSGPSGTGAFGTADQLGKVTTEEWDAVRTGAVQMISGLLRIDAPVISAVNGPALRHCEIPLMADIVLAAEEATFQDTAHFVNRIPPEMGSTSAASSDGPHSREVLSLDRTGDIGAPSLSIRARQRSVASRAAITKGLGTGPAASSSTAGGSTKHQADSHAAVEGVDERTA